MLIFISFLFLSMKFLDTFSGIGGFSLPLTDLGHDCIGYSEIEPKAIQVYRYHFSTHQPYGDITRIEEQFLPDFDLLVGGFPCQAFSIAGKRGGFADTRGTLFFDLARILQAKKPRLFIFENVKGLLSHDSGRTFATIIATLAELGYDVQWQVLNSRNFGVPQNRERVFIAGHLGGFGGRQVFPLTESAGDSGEANGEVASVPVPPVTCQGGRNCRGAFIANCLDANYSKGPNAGGKNGRTLIGRWVNKETGIAVDETVPSLRASGGTDIRKMPVVMKTVATIGDRADGHYLPRERVLDSAGIARAVTTNDSQMPFYGIQCQGADRPQSQRMYGLEGISPTLTTPTGGNHVPAIMLRDGRDNRACLRAGRPTEVGIAGMSIRRLTPRECEALQAFPRGWTEWGLNEKGEKIQMSDSARYRMCGNAVTTSVVREIAKRLPVEL